MWQEQEEKWSKHAIDTQNIFRGTIRNAESKSIKVNMGKTALVCISDAFSFKAVAHVYSVEGTKLESSNSLKLLGFRFGQRPSCHAKVKEAIRRAFRARYYWLLIHMKQHRFSEQKLIKACEAHDRVLFSSVPFHAERQTRWRHWMTTSYCAVLRYIYGYGLSYA